MTTVGYDPFDVLARIPVDALREMRATCPVARIDVGWLLTTYADVTRAVRDVESFRTSYREPGVVVPEEEQLLPEMPEPRHGKVRRIVNAVVGWHKAVRMEGFIRELSHEYLDRLLEQGGGDLVAEYAAPIPINVDGRDARGAAGRLAAVPAVVRRGGPGRLPDPRRQRDDAPPARPTGRRPGAAGAAAGRQDRLRGGVGQTAKTWCSPTPTLGASTARAGSSTWRSATGRSTCGSR